MMLRTRFAIASVVVVGLAAGCGRTAIDRHRITGTITCGGEPVVAGEVLFTPDGSKHNAGPQGVAMIFGGRFDTSGSRAPGVGGGPTIVRVVGEIVGDETRIVRHEFRVDLPRSDHEFAIDIPAGIAEVRTGPEI